MIQVVTETIEFCEDELGKELHIETLKWKKKEINSLIEKSRHLIEPKAVYTYLKIAKIDGDGVQLEDGYKLKGIILKDMLKSGQKVAPYVVTIGPKLETQVSKLERDDFFLAFVLDKIGSYALRKVKEQIKMLVQKKLGNTISDFGPGEVPKLFGIDQQRVLFRILEPLKNVGVQLTPSYMMIPRKSVSGVFANTDEEYVACQYCPKKCEYRKSTFIGEYHLAV